MTIVLYDLVGADNRRFSPNCWRTRMALAHKELDVDARATRFTEIPKICGGGHKTVPVIEDGDNVVRDSWQIALYLEQTYGDRPSLFGGAGGEAMTRFFQTWVMGNVYAKLPPLIIADIHDHLEDEDKEYFRTSRETLIGKSLEEVQANREARLADFREALQPVRMMLGKQPFLGGEGPLYADHILFATLQWPRVVSPFPLLEDDDPVKDWFERCLDLYGGLGRSQHGYEW